MFITSQGNAAGITINDFFPVTYNDRYAVAKMGITIPANSHVADDVQLLVRSPIALDLNGDGLKYVNYTGWGLTHFDIDNDGFAENMEWLDKDEGTNDNYLDSTFIHVKVA